MIIIIMLEDKARVILLLSLPTVTICMGLTRFVNVHCYIV